MKNYNNGDFAMARRLLVAVILLLVISSCKTSSKTVTRDRIVNDTLITHTTKSVILPVKNITKIDRPCSKNSLKPLEQIITTPHATVSLREESGNLVVEVNTDSIINERVREELRRFEKDTTVEKEIITRYRVPGWMWYVVAYAVLVTVWLFRRFIPILNLIP